MPATVAPAELFPPAPGSHEPLGRQAGYCTASSRLPCPN